MSKRKDSKTNAHEDSFDLNWEEEGDVSLDDTWDPSAFTAEQTEPSTFDNWEITLEDDILEMSQWSEAPTQEEHAQHESHDNDLALPSLETSVDLSPDHELDALVVLPWETIGTLLGSDIEFAVQLNPSQLHSTWCAPQREEGMEGPHVLMVQGIRFDIQFQYQGLFSMGIVNA